MDIIIEYMIALLRMQLGNNDLQPGPSWERTKGLTQTMEVLSHKRRQNCPNQSEAGIRVRCTCDKESMHKTDLHASEERAHADPVGWQVGEEPSH